MPKRDQLSTGSKFESGFLVQLPQPDGFDLRLARLGLIVDLTRWHFPDRGLDGHAFLPDQEKLSLFGHRRDDHGRFAMNDGPGAGFVMRRRFYQFGVN